MKKHPLGDQLLIELYGCDREVLDDVDAISRHMLAAAAACGATVVGHGFHRFSPHGVSGVVIIAESHLTVHTWPEHRYAAVDVFTCGGTLLAERAVAYLREALGCDGHEVTRVVRGLARPPEPGSPAPPLLFPELVRYDDEFVRRFVAPELAAPRREDAPRLVTEIAEQVYRFPLLTPEFCRLLIEEVEHRSGWAGAADAMGLTSLSLAGLPGAAALYTSLVRRHIQPLLEGLWTTYRVQSWDPPAVRRHEPAAARPSEPGHEDETVGMIGCLNRGFTGGGTHFPRWGITFGDSGSVPVGSFIVFPGGVSHAHLARPVTHGRRYTLAGSFF